MKVAVLFDFLGPYHRARLDAAAQSLEVAAIEVCENSAEYAWERPQEGTRFRLVPLMAQSTTNGSSEPGLRRRVFAALDDIRPDAVVLLVGGQRRILPNDDVIVRVGGDPPYAFLQRAGVRIVRKDVPIPNADFASAS